MRCIAFGRRIETDFALPGAVGDEKRGSPDIVIRRVAPGATRDASAATLWRDGDTLHFAPPGIAEYRITPDKIEIAPCPGVDDGDIVALLIATALPGLLWLEGAVMLHAAAAILPGHDRAVAIAASSGTGKSTMLAQLVAHGADIVADDSVCLRPTATGIAASGLAGGYFAHDPDPAARPFVPVGRGRGVKERPLGAVLILARHATDRPETFCRLAPLEALTAILSHRHRAAIPALFGKLGRRLEDVARVAREPAYLWSRRDGAIGLTTAEWHAIDRIGRGGSDD